jgi:hypothetical protein
MAVTTEALLESVARIEPILRDHAAEAESRRRLSDAAAAAMKEVGLYRMWTPLAYGGLEVDPMTAVRVLEEVARIDSAAAWNLAIHIDTRCSPFTSARGGPPRSMGEETRSWRARCSRRPRQFPSRVGFVSTGALRSRAAPTTATGSS